MSFEHKGSFGHDGKTVYFCVDLEASGPAPGLFNMVSIGGVVVRWDGARHVRDETFYHELRPEFPGFDPGAMAIHKLSREHLEAKGEDTREVLRSIAAFVKTHCPKGRPLFVGHNAPFDWMFTAWHYAWAEQRNPFGYNALDTKALMMGKHGISWWDSGKSKLLELYPHLREPDPELVHNALADAEFQADILIALLDD